jgi:di/tricarboxylate transporter
MTLPQGLAFGLVALTIVAFVWGRWRYDLIAVVALLAGLVVGVIPMENAFAGFQNDVTVIIACALVVSAAFARSGLVEDLLRPVLPHLKSARVQVPVLTAAVTVLSMATKNVGALAIMLPVALQVARQTGTSTSCLLMPMAFGAMVGGMVTLVGTSPNIIVSEVRQELLGQPFQMYDFAPVGLIITALSLVFLSFGYRLLPGGREAKVNLDAALAANAYLTEVTVPEGWTLPKRRLADLKAMAGEDLVIMGLVRSGKRRLKPHFNTIVQPGDTLLIEGEQQTLDSFISRAKLQLTRSDKPIAMAEPTEEVRVVEAVVGAESSLVNKSAQQIDLHGQHNVNLLGVSRSGFRIVQDLRSVRLRANDIILLQGSEKNLPKALEALGLLPLAEREVRLGGPRRKYTPALVLAAAMVLVAFQVVPVSVAFFGAAVVIIALGGLRMREAYTALDGPLLVLIAALIPVSDAIQETGGADLIASGLASVFGGMPPLAAVTAVMFLAMAATPFLNNAATVLIVAPIGASLAKQIGMDPDPLLMAVAVGAACDFLTPIGHQCNTLVMGPGGYKFTDYPRLGAPLTVLVLLLGPSLILLFWSP